MVNDKTNERASRPASGLVIKNVDPDHATTEPIDSSIQAGVQQVQAIATVWSKTSRAVVYFLIWVVYFVMLMQQAGSNSLAPWVTSAYQGHSLTPTIGVISSIFGGVCSLPAAKVIDIFGRPAGYAFFLLLTTLGLIMMACTNSIEMYAAAQVFWTVGNNTLLYTINIFIADTTSLHNRVLVTWLAASPNLATTFIGGPMAEAFLNGPGWKWYYGAFSIIVPVMCIPLFGVLWINHLKAKQQGIIPKGNSNRSILDSFVYYCREFDIIGLILLCAGLSMFLLPFHIYTMQDLGWRSPLIICLLTFGIVILILFGIWERLFAPVEFIPFALLLDRNVIGASILSMAMFISYFCWFSFFTSFLQAVQNLSVSSAGYVSQIYSLGGSVSGIAVGFMIHRTGHYKAITLYGALPVYTLFMGLMIHFRSTDTGVGYLIMCQIFVSLAAGAITAIAPLPAMAAASHQHIAAVVAILSMFSSVGGAVGLTVASSVWQTIFPTKLMEYLPAEELENFPMIYGMLEVQLSYPLGSPARVAIQHAYSDAQKMMTITSTAICVAAFVAVAIWRNDDVRAIKQVRGNVI